jgi:hypothetical protein
VEPDRINPEDRAKAILLRRPRRPLPFPELLAEEPEVVALIVAALLFRNREELLDGNHRLTCTLAEALKAVGWTRVTKWYTGEVRRILREQGLANGEGRVLDLVVTDDVRALAALGVPVEVMPMPAAAAATPDSALIADRARALARLGADEEATAERAAALAALRPLLERHEPDELSALLGLIEVGGVPVAQLRALLDKSTAPN